MSACVSWYTNGAYKITHENQLSPTVGSKDGPQLLGFLLRLLLPTEPSCQFSLTFLKH